MGRQRGLRRGGEGGQEESVALCALQHPVRAPLSLSPPLSLSLSLLPSLFRRLSEAIFDTMHVRLGEVRGCADRRGKRGGRERGGTRAAQSRGRAEKEDLLGFNVLPLQKLKAAGESDAGPAQAHMQGIIHEPSQGQPRRSG